MANQTITFDPESGVAYGANLTINGGANFKSTFEVKRPNGTAFNFTGYSGSSQMVKSAAVGSTVFPEATFTVGFTSAVDGLFYLSFGTTDTSALSGGRYVYNILYKGKKLILPLYPSDHRLD